MLSVYECLKSWQLKHLTLQWQLKIKDIMAHNLEKVKFITWFFYENFILHSLEYTHFFPNGVKRFIMSEKFMPFNQLPSTTGCLGQYLNECLPQNRYFKN